ncbi:MAG: leucyl/phenylalanyl-tRNA--protein transferase [Acidimicrobiales bacterium]|nr:MAG: leucyl/phenylalanyl-tRNA--protein transferase [Acidimicrobiales bacterium]
MLRHVGQATSETWAVPTPPPPLDDPIEPPPGPIEPPPSAWGFHVPLVGPGPSEPDLVGVGADLQPGTLLAAYRSGVFPMPVPDPLGGSALAWWSPDPRAVLPLDGLRVARSLARSIRRFEVRVDTAFEAVVEACADSHRSGGWITAEVAEAYRHLHRLGWAHSVEAWAAAPGGPHRDQLVGGLYGLAIGGLFAGESMFHRRPDASKVALVGLVELLSAGDASLLDVQWNTPHLASLGAVEVSRAQYLARLDEALVRPGPRWPGSRPSSAGRGLG